MPLPNYVAQTDIFFTWLDAFNNTLSHIDNTSAYLLVAQNATPRISTGNVSLNGTATVTTLNVSDSVTANTFTGNGYSLTTLNASALASGTIPLDRLTSANTTAKGVVDIDVQTFAGDKTFQNNLVVLGTLTIGNSTITINSSTILVGNASSNLVINTVGIQANGVPFSTGGGGSNLGAGKLWSVNASSTTGNGTGNGFSLNLNSSHNTTLNTAFQYKVTLTSANTTLGSGATYLVRYNANTAAWENRVVAISGKDVLLSSDTYVSPTVVKSVAQTGGGTSNSLAFNLTTAPPENQLLLAFITHSRYSAPTANVLPPAGWSVLVEMDHTVANLSQRRLCIYYKVTGNAEPSSYTFGITNTEFHCGFIYQINNINPTTPIDVYANGTTTGASTITTPAVTPTQLGGIYFGVVGTDLNKTSTTLQSVKTTNSTGTVISTYESTDASNFTQTQVAYDDRGITDVTPVSLYFTESAHRAAHFATIVINPSVEGASNPRTTRFYNPHPLLTVSNASVKAYTNNATNQLINYVVEATQLDQSNTTFHTLGADYHWQRYGDTLYYTDGNVILGNTSELDAYKLSIGGSVRVTNAITATTITATTIIKSSGSFRIPHPLPEKRHTHDLVHSFIEGPQADLIYRGTTQLSNGQAVINLDTAAGMTEGTFILLCRNTQCIVTNDSDWDLVRGSVNNNLLTIDSQNTSSSATVSWVVFGERRDQHMYDTDWTDDEGHVIVEPERT